MEAGKLEQHDAGGEPDHERDPEARPGGRERGRDERAAQRVTARPGGVERDEVHSVPVERRSSQRVPERRARPRRRRTTLPSSTPPPLSARASRAASAATSTSRSERTTCPGRVTISVTPTPSGWNGACEKRDEPLERGRCRRRRAGERHRVLDRPLVEARRRARGDQDGERARTPPLPLPRGYAAGTRSRSADGTTSKRAGVAPIGSPSTSSGSGSAALIATEGDRSSSTFGCER